MRNHKRQYLENDAGNIVCCSVEYVVYLRDGVAEGSCGSLILPRIMRVLYHIAWKKIKIENSKYIFY